ncbi:MAG: phosphatase PAP2 family protein [Lachnospiraceae bacterium]|nr:phosphatase PAP2 family protein [Lachnospiraceae bacterium]
MKKYIDEIFTCVFCIAFVVLTLLVKFVDVAVTEPNSIKVGLATINEAFRKLVGHNSNWELLSTLLGIIALAVMAFMAFLGLWQLVKEKSLKKVDKQIYAIGGLYVLTVLFYVLFEIFEVNQRPGVIGVEPEASYPSSHTLLAIVAFVSVAHFAKHYGLKFLNYFISSKSSTVFEKNESSDKLFFELGIAIRTVAGLAVVSRALSGVHWLTDIVAGVFLGVALILGYKCLSRRFD